MRRRTWPAIGLLVALAVTMWGCGPSSSRSANKSATLILDFTPNAVHAGIYSALARGYDREQGIALHVEIPSASTDSIKLLEAGRAQFAILDIHDLAIARERGEDIVGIMAIVERPLAAVIASPAVGTPRQLVGKTVGISGVPSDTAVLDSIVAGSGGDPSNVRTITIGFNAVPELLARRVAGATAFWDAEGVTLRRKRPGFHVFRVDDYGAPPYPELVLCATASTVSGDPSLASAIVRALARGYGVTISDPKASENDFLKQVPGSDPTLLAAELHALEPAFRAPDGSFGTLDPAVLKRWARWEVQFGIVRRTPSVADAFDRSFTAGT